MHDPVRNCRYSGARRLLVLLTGLALLPAAAATSAIAQYTPDAKARWELLNLIRTEKFKLILPGAMRDNGVNMWIHVIRRGDPDAFAVDFGATMGHIVFTDLGNRIEKGIFGIQFAEIADRSIYDFRRPLDELPAYVAQHDPRVIAINMSTELTHADGLSHTDYMRLTEMIGNEYSSRLVSSTNVITDFRVRRVQTEIRTYAMVSETKRQIMEAAYRRIVPGITKREDISWWVQNQLIERGIEPSYFMGPGASPGVMHSDVSTPEQTQRSDYIYQRGDLMSWDWGFDYLNMDSDWKRNGYILKEGETDVPESVQKAWQFGLDAREILREELRVGRTAGETLASAAAALERAGYVYTPFKDTDEDERIIQELEDDPRPGISIDCHTVGNTGNSEVSIGAAIAPFRPYRAHLMIQPMHLFSFEYIVHVYVPEWEERLAINFEDNHVITHNGVEYLYPPNQNIILIP